MNNSKKFRILLVFGLFFMIMLFVILVYERRHIKALGKNIGEINGKIVGTAIGSWNGITEGVQEGIEAGTNAGLSAEDTIVK